MTVNALATPQGGEPLPRRRVGLTKVRQPFQADMAKTRTQPRNSERISTIPQHPRPTEKIETSASFTKKPSEFSEFVNRYFFLLGWTRRRRILGDPTMPPRRSSPKPPS